MIVIGGLVIGVLLGLWRAKKLGGRGPDMAQYGAVYGMIFAVIGLIATLVIHRLL